MAALAESIQDQSSEIAGLRLPAILRLAEPMSDEELIVFAALNPDYRIESNANGELEIMSPLGERGGKGEAFVIRCLDIWAEQNGGESFSSNTGFRLSPRAVRCPDAAWMSAERWASMTREQQAGFPPLAPEFVVELTSATDLRKTVEAKMQMWMDAGAKLAWLIDPYAAEVLVYRPNREPEQLERPDWVEADSVVPGFRLETSRIWEQP